MSMLQLPALRQQSRSWRPVSRTSASEWASADYGLIRRRHKSCGWAPIIRSMSVASPSCRRTSTFWSPLTTLTSLSTIRCRPNCQPTSLHCVGRRTINFARLYSVAYNWSCDLQTGVPSAPVVIRPRTGVPGWRHLARIWSRSSPVSLVCHQDMRRSTHTQQMRVVSCSAAGPRVWNSLPSHLRQSYISYNDFKRQLKTLVPINRSAAPCEICFF